MLTNIRNLEKRRTFDCLTGAGCSYLFALLRSWRIAVLSSSSCCSPEAGQRVQQVLSQLDLASCAGCSYLFALLRSWRIAVLSSSCCCRLAGGRVTERQVGPGIQRSACGLTAAPVLATMDPRLLCLWFSAALRASEPWVLSDSDALELLSSAAPPPKNDISKGNNRIAAHILRTGNPILDCRTLSCSTASAKIGRNIDRSKNRRLSQHSSATQTFFIGIDSCRQ